MDHLSALMVGSGVALLACLLLFIGLEDSNRPDTDSFDAPGELWIMTLCTAVEDLKLLCRRRIHLAQMDGCSAA